MLSTSELERALAAAGLRRPRALRGGYRLHERDGAGLAEEGAPEWTLVAANHQTAGRGRMGRTWVDRPGGALMCSFVLRPVTLDPAVGRAAPAARGRLDGRGGARRRGRRGPLQVAERPARRARQGRRHPDRVGDRLRAVPVRGRRHRGEPRASARRARSGRPRAGRSGRPPHGVPPPVPGWLRPRRRLRSRRSSANAGAPFRRRSAPTSKRPRATDRASAAGRSTSTSSARW